LSQSGRHEDLNCRRDPELSRLQSVVDLQDVGAEEPPTHHPDHEKPEQVNHFDDESGDLGADGEDVNVFPGLVEVSADDSVRHHFRLVLVDGVVQDCVTSDFQKLQNDANDRKHLHRQIFADWGSTVVKKENFLENKFKLFLYFTM
jgi:hypothetical protein